MSTGGRVAIVLAAGLAIGCGLAKKGESQNGCQVCKGGCANGLVTMCLVLTPPGCGAQSSLEFCPYGCTPQGPEPCNFYPVDGAVPSGCIASSAQIAAGKLKGSPTPTATTSFSPGGPIVTIATGADAACHGADSDGGQAPAGSGVVLTLALPSNTAGTFPVGVNTAALTIWKDGSVEMDHQSATAGSVMVNVNDPIGGLVGSYDLTFGVDREQGTFIAPACDACKGPFH